MIPPGNDGGLPDGIRVPEAWPPLVDALRAVRTGDGPVTVVVAGRTDTGKTTLSRYLARRLGGSGSVARIDGDPGQSTIGPPGTVGLALRSGEGDDPRTRLRFVGAASPAGHFLQALTGIRRLADVARDRDARAVVLDSSGYMDTPGGREYHHQVVDALDPDHLVVLGGGGRLPALVRPFRRRAGTEIHEVPVPAAVQPRDRERRRAYRRRRLRAHFEGAGERRLDLREIGHHGHVPDPGDADAVRGLLAGVLDRDGFLLVAGAIRTIEPGREVVLRSPPFDREEVGSLQFGSMRAEFLLGGA